MTKSVKITSSTNTEETARLQSALVSNLLSQASPEEIFSKGGIFSQLKKQIVEKVLEGLLATNPPNFRRSVC